LGRNTGSKYILKEPAHGARVGAHRADLVEADELVVEAKVLHAARVAADADLVGAFAEVLAAHAALGELRWHAAGVAVIEGVVVGRGGMRVAAVDVGFSLRVLSAEALVN
jgi:hypothetical protein